MTTSFFTYSNLIDLQILKERLPIITTSFINVLIEYRLIILSLVLLVSTNVFFSKSSNLLLKILIITTFFCVFYVYVIYLTTIFELKWHLNTSLNRIFFPFTGIIFTLNFLLCNYDKKKILNL